MAWRVCDNCGTKMPPFHPRKRAEDGRLLCDGCHPDGAGNPGRPIGVHSKQAGIMDYYEVVVLRRGNEAGMVEYGTADLGEAVQRAEEIFGNKTESAAEASERLGKYVNVDVINTGNGSVFWHNGQPRPGARFVSRKVAHDSGDGETIYHCPFCGSGQVVQRSDKTVECSFCHTCFTVQVQPEHSSMPQTINGQPIDMPGMPGDSTVPPDAAAGQEPPGTPGAEVKPFVPPGSAPAFVPPVAAAPVPPAQMAASRHVVGYDDDDDWDDDEDEDDEDDFENEVVCQRCARVWGNEEITNSRCPACGYPFTKETSTGGNTIWLGRPLMAGEASRKEAGRFHCPGSNSDPVAPNSVDEDGYTSTTIGNFTQHHAATYGVCSECREPKPLLKSGKLPKHDRYLSWKQQGEMGLRPESSRFYSNGDVALPEESFIRHLAIKHADDPQAVIEAVKAERTPT